MEQDYNTIDLLEIFLLLKKKVVLIISVGVLFGVMGGLYSYFLIEPIYEASATMLVNTRQDQNAIVTSDQINSAKNLVATYSIIIKSDAVLEPVIQELNLPFSYEQLQSKVAVTAVDATQVMRIAVRDENPLFAKNIVEAITQVAPDIIKEKVEAGSVNVISEARASTIPVSPNKTKNIAIATLAGLVLIVGFIVIKELLNNTIVTDEDIKKHLNIPVLGIIPKVEE